MLLALQQLITSPKTAKSVDSSSQEKNSLAALNGEKSEFGTELVDLLKGMNPEEVKSFIADLPKELQAELTALNPEMFVEQTSLKALGQFSSLKENMSLPSLEGKVSQNQDLDTLMLDQSVNQELDFENNGKVQSSNKISQFLNKVFSNNETKVAEGAERSPAIDFAPENVDAKLMNFEDFALQKNAVKKHQSVPTYEGMNPKKELDLKTTEVVNSIAPASEGQNSAQFILNMMSETSSPKLETAQAEKVTPQFDFSQVKSGDVKVIMNQISDYILQAKAAKEPTVNFKMNHQDLGVVDITVAKAMGHQNAVAINIEAQAFEGKQFFTQNLKELTAHLSSSGIQVTDIKVDSSQNSKSDFDFNQQQRHAESGQKNFGSEQNQRRHDQEKRQSLWDLLNNKEAA